MANEVHTISLHGVDRSYDFLQRLWDTSNRLLLSVTISSVLLIGIAVGMLTVDEQVEILGLKFKLASWVIFGGGAFVIAMLLMSFHTIEAHAMVVGDAVRDLYKSAGAEQLLKYPLDGIFDTPNVMVSAVSFLNEEAQPKRFKTLVKTDNAATLVIVFILIIGLPLAAEIMAGIRIASLYSWRWWAWSPFVGLILLNLASFATFMIRVW